MKKNSAESDPGLISGKKSRIKVNCSTPEKTLKSLVRSAQKNNLQAFSYCFSDKFSHPDLNEEMSKWQTLLKNGAKIELGEVRDWGIGEDTLSFLINFQPSQTGKIEISELWMIGFCWKNRREYKCQGLIKYEEREPDLNLQDLP